MIVNYQKKIEVVNSCLAVFDETDLINAILWYSSKPVSRQKRVFVSGAYPAVSIYKEKIHIHRLLMMYWLESKIPDDFCVHHIDGDRLNCRKENILLVNISDHQRLHNKGKRISDWQKEQIRKSNKTRFNPNRCPKTGRYVHEVTA
jgi:hypothetical protein